MAAAKQRRRRVEARMSDQASRIAAKFGGVPELAKAIGRRAPSVYKWLYPRERGGTGGLIPSSAVPSVLDAADLLGVTLTQKDWTP